jgi:transferase CAF17, mitochondrial
LTKSVHYLYRKMRLPLLMHRGLTRLLYGNSSAFSTQPLPKFGLEKLENRAVLRVSGIEASAFLQGLITNDMRHLEEGATSMFCMFLNTKGRVVFDSIIYTDSAAENSFLVECDKAAENLLKKHLTMYKVRRKINIECPSVSVYAAFGEQAEGKIDELASNNKTLVTSPDPRLKDLGFRLIDLDNKLSPSCSGLYKGLRLGFGVGEGIEELPLGNCFPLEANCDYLHGVSFHKGCYIGQELTARTHHTGVVRKRLMPIFIPKLSDLPPIDTVIMDPDGKNVGKLRGINKSGEGVALLRINEVLKAANNLKIGDYGAVTKKPDWWPSEASKDKFV